MNLWLRVVWLLTVSRWREPAPFLSPVRMSLRCWPNDIDPLMHMNNGRYFTLLDLGRAELLIRAGVWRRLRRLGIAHVVASECMQFRRSLKLFERAELETRILGWEGKSLYFRQDFYRKGELAASAIVRTRWMRSDRSAVAPGELLSLAGITAAESPPLPDWVRAWDQGLREQFERSDGRGGS